MTQPLDVASLSDVVWSSGRVFDGLTTGRLNTERFLRSGDTNLVSSRMDLILLKDLRDAAKFVVTHTDLPVDSDFVRRVNRTLRRSAALAPGRLRTDDDHIGVSTRYGRHEPPGVTEDGLQGMVEKAMTADAPREQALNLFLEIARSQPFMDGNKRTAIFVANSVLIRGPETELLTIPADPTTSRTFMDLLARAYIYGEDEPLKALLRDEGFKPVQRSIGGTGLQGRTAQPTQQGLPGHGGLGL